MQEKADERLPIKSNNVLMKQPAVDNTRKPHADDESSGSSGSESGSDVEDSEDVSDDDEQKKQAAIAS